jgi:hypothetical protein
VGCFPFLAIERYFGVEESLGFLDRQPCEDEASCYGVNLAVGMGCGTGPGNRPWHRAVDLAAWNLAGERAGVRVVVGCGRGWAGVEVAVALDGPEVVRFSGSS